MVETGQPAPGPGAGRPARPIHYAPSGGTTPFECFTMGELRDRTDPTELSDLQQPNFHLVIAGTHGEAAHEVDFEPVRLNRYRWLHIRPGQVHRWFEADCEADSEADFEADLILLAPTGPNPHWRSGPRIIEFDERELHDIEPLLQLARQHRRTRTDLATQQALGDLIMRWLGLDRTDDGADPVYNEFRTLLDSDAGHARSVELYAAELGCSPRTLTRICRRASGRSPKELIDEAVSLQARRLLALPHATVTTTAESLGFDEVTNFTKFFKRVCGQTPTAWQAGHGYRVPQPPASGIT